ncbi:MAG: hypothetical protein RR575_00725 [Acinetobacter sp.]
MQKQEFEVHLTADLDRNSILYHQFKMLCIRLDAKPLEIILARGEYPRQMMLSKVVLGKDLASILMQLDIWIEEFKQHNIQIIRTKVEVPFQIQNNQLNQVVDYYEWHALIEYHDSLALKKLCDTYHVHLSHNALKQQENYRFLTLRETGMETTFLARLQDVKAELFNQNRVIIKERLESCIHDTNMILDVGWLLSE